MPELCQQLLHGEAHRISQGPSEASSGRSDPADLFLVKYRPRGPILLLGLHVIISQGLFGRLQIPPFSSMALSIVQDATLTKGGPTVIRQLLTFQPHASPEVA